MTNSASFTSEYFLDVINRLEEINGQLLELKNVWMPEADQIELNKLIHTAENPYNLRSVPGMLFEDFDFRKDVVSGKIEWFEYKYSYFGFCRSSSAFLSELMDPPPGINLKVQVRAFEELVKEAKRLKSNSEKVETVELKNLGLELYEFWRELILDYWETCDIPLGLAEASQLKKELSEQNDELSKAEFREWVQNKIDKYFEGEAVDPYKKALKTGDPNDLGLLIQEWYDFAKSPRKIRVKESINKEWQNYEKPYFYSRSKRAEFAENIDNAIAIIQEDKRRKEREEALRNELAKNNDEVLDALDEVVISSNKKGFVYFIRNQDIYKIGITQNLLRRLEQLNPDEVLNTVRCSNFDQLEKDLHKLFKENRIPQTEYFRLTTSQVEEVHQLMTTKAKF